MSNLTELPDIPTWQERAKAAGDWPLFSGDAVAPYLKAEVEDLRAVVARRAQPEGEAPQASIGDEPKLRYLIDFYGDADHSQRKGAMERIVTYIDKWADRRAAQLDGGQEGNGS